MVSFFFTVYLRVVTQTATAFLSHIHHDPCIFVQAATPDSYLTTVAGTHTMVTSQRWDRSSVVVERRLVEAWFSRIHAKVKPECRVYLFGLVSSLD